MKKIYCILFVCFLTLISVQTFAQSLGIQAGLNMSKLSVKDDEDNYSDEVDMLMGFNGGVNFEIGFGDLFAIQAALIAETKGYKIKDFDEPGDEFKTSALYIDLPVLLKVGPSFGPVKLFGAAGPYIGMGVAGKWKYESADGEKYDDNIKWGSGEDDDAKPLDFGAKFGVGAEFSKFSIGVYYSLGLANIAVDTEGGYKESTRALSITAGYRIFGK